MQGTAKFERLVGARASRLEGESLVGPPRRLVYRSVQKSEDHEERAARPDAATPHAIGEPIPVFRY